LSEALTLEDNGPTGSTGSGIAGFGGPRQQPGGGFGVLRDAVTRQVQFAEIGLCHRKPLIGGAAKPFHRARRIAPDPAAIAVEHTDVELRRGMSLRGGPLEP